MNFYSICIAAVIFLFPLKTIAQEIAACDNQLYGFVRADAFYDTRNSIEAVDGMFLLYPANSFYDSAGNDINDISRLTMTSISSRIGLNMNGKKILNSKAKLNAKIEADFTARSNSNSLRLRHAFVGINFDKHKLLMGRTWHPMFTPMAFPLTLSINIGTPFNPLSRSPQIRYTYVPNDNITIIAAALYQNDAKNLGPDANDEVNKELDLMRNSKVPNLHLQGVWNSNKLILGILGDYKKLQPRTFTTGDDGIFKTNNTVESYTGGIFLNVSHNKFKLKAKSIYGQNLTDHLLTGGYAIKTRNYDTGKETYTVSNHIFNWVNVEYGKQLMGGILLGYSKNLGFNHNVKESSPILARGADIDYLYRVSTYMRWKKNKIELWAETEMTTAAYGDINYNNKGKVDNSNEISNIRFQFSCVYLIL